MSHELGKVQPQFFSHRIVSNQSSGSTSSSSTIASSKPVKMRKPLLNERWTSVLYTAVAALSYVTAGTTIGWSSGTFRRTGQTLPQLDNWSISLAATPALMITVIALVVHRSYRWIGTKAYLMTAALLAMGSSVLEAYGQTFWSASAGRILGGISAGIAFTLLPSYVDEFGSSDRVGLGRPPLDEILTAAFPFGVLLRFVADILPAPISPLWAALQWAAFPAASFVGLLFLPESARFLCSTGCVSQAADVLHRTHEPSSHPALQASLARWQQPSPGLFEAISRQANLTLIVPLLSLFAFQAFIGAIPMLFYLADLLELAGQGGPEPNRAAALLVFAFIVTIKLSRFLYRRQHLDKTLLVTSGLIIALATIGLGWHCHQRRIHAPDATTAALNDWPLYAFAVLYISYAVGFHRIPGTLLATEADDENRFALHTLSTAISWGSVYLAVRLLPVLLRNIGLGWVLWNIALVALFTVAVVLLCLPEAGDGNAHKVLPVTSRASSSSSTSSTCSSSLGSNSPTLPCTCWPCSNCSNVAAPETSSTVVQIFSYAPPNSPKTPDPSTPSLNII